MTDNALAIREMSLAEIGRRIELNRQSGWGLERGTPAQLNLLALYCQKRGLLPGDEVTLYEGKPWITIDGHVTLMKRDHRDDYRGFAQRPLSRTEKEDWGYDPEDLVVETTIRSVSMGEIKAYGKVAKDERYGGPAQGRRLNPVARFNPVEMAQKRSLARAHRFAYGLDSYVDDEEFQDEVRTVIQERNDADRNASGAATYDRTIGAEYDAQDRNWQPAEPAPEAEPVELVKSVRHSAYQELSGLLEAAGAGGIDTEPFQIALPATLADIRARIALVQHAIEQAQVEPAEASF